MKRNAKALMSPLVSLDCPFRYTLDVLAGKWKFAIIYSLLKNGVLRFKELERDVEGITSRMLVKELKMLEKHGIVSRKAYATVPPTVEYRLTDCGKSLAPVIKTLQSWGENHLIKKNKPTVKRIDAVEI